ncbi:MAG: YebC/PmpR family DNA-binding transcriptional regulator, partial [Marinobacter sp.]
DHSAIFVFKGEEESALEALMEADVDVTDIENEDGQITVFTPNTEYAKARLALTDAFADIDFDVDDIQFLPKTTTAVEGDDIPLFEKFLDMLNELDDVQNIFHNAELPEE